MVLNTEWTQLEIIELLNETSSSAAAAFYSSTAVAAAAAAGKQVDRVSSAAAGATSVGGGGSSSSSSGGGSGFGFGITGNKSTGVVVKAITPGGSAFRVSTLWDVYNMYSLCIYFLIRESHILSIGF